MSTYPWINDASNVGGPIGYLAITSPNGLYLATGLNITNLNQLSLSGGSTITDTSTDLVIQPPLNQTLQLGSSVYVDTLNNRVGINVPAPTEDLELDGNFQMNTGATSKIVFYDTPNAHEHAEITASGEGVDGGALHLSTKEDGGAVAKKITINNKGAIGIGDTPIYGSEGQVLGTMGNNAPPQWVNSWAPITTLPLPVSPYTGQQLIYEHQALGNIGSLLPMIYDGNKWRPTGSATLVRWTCGTASQTFTSTTPTNVSVGDYATITFTPPWDGYYEIGQTCFRWELNSGIGMNTFLSATDGTAHHRLYYTEDWNGPYQHWRAGVSCPIVYYLYSTKTYRFTASITYAFGNSGTINFSGTAYVKALSTFGP